VPLHAVRRIVQVDHQRGYLNDQSGTREGPFDLIVAADGAASLLHAQLPSVVINRPYPWATVWCLLPLRDWP
jgi:2-polyprenyl-6-methoxyphenol hydroxylase-like FAD-dependent oxidoreductase